VIPFSRTAVDAPTRTNYSDLCMTINKVLGTNSIIIWQLSLFLDWGMEVVNLLPFSRNFECNTIIPRRKKLDANTMKNWTI